MYVPDLACRCAKKAKAKGWTFFGLQFYGKDFHCSRSVVLHVLIRRFMVANLLPKSASSLLPVDMGRSKTFMLKLPNKSNTRRSVSIAL